MSYDVFPPAVSTFTQTTVINSIQYGTVTINSAVSATQTATITSVDTSKSVLIWLGSSYDTATDNPQLTHGRITLTNATTVTATRNTADTKALTINFCVVEFK